MPKLMIDGEEKKFPYTKKGKKMAKKAKKKKKEEMMMGAHKMPGGMMMSDKEMEGMAQKYKMNKMKNKKSHYSMKV